jgi:hypothetical protein
VGGVQVRVDWSKFLSHGSVTDVGMSVLMEGAGRRNRWKVEQAVCFSSVTNIHVFVAV